MLLGGPSYQETWSSSSSNLDPYWRLYSTANHKGSPPALLLSRPLHGFKVSRSNSTVFSNKSFSCLGQKHDKWCFLSLQDSFNYQQDQCLVDPEACYWCWILEWPTYIHSGATDYEQGLPHLIPPPDHDTGGEKAHCKWLISRNS